MTKQEWIIKNDKPGVYVGAYREGLAKGLEIAECFSEWKENNYIKVWNKYCRRYGVLEDTGSHKTTAELLEIYLTENEKNNVDKNS